MSTAIDLSAVARVVGIKTEFRDLRSGNVLFLPQRIAVLAQGRSDSTYSSDKRRVNSAAEAGSVYGFGSPAHLAVRELLPSTGGGVGTIPVTVYPLEDAETGEAATADITPSGTATESAAYRVIIGGIESAQFVIGPDDDVADMVTAITEAINSVPEMPAIATDNATDVSLEAKWAGESGNDISISLVSANVGVDFALTEFTGGLVNPDTTDALAQMGDVWETMLLNTLNPDDTTTLDALSTFGEGRWGARTRKPLVALAGFTGTDVADAEALTAGRETDRTNVILTAPGSPNLPFVAAAAQLAQIAPVANNNPARDYGSLQARSLTPGADGEQWDYLTRDRAVKEGVSTSIIRSGVVTLQDVVTMYRPEGEPFPAYRHVCDIVKIMQLIFNIDLEFATPEWDGAPLIPDDQPTANRDAKKPKTALMAIGSLADNLALAAIISDAEFTKNNSTAQISAQNPKRLDVTVTVKLSGNANIISVDLDFGFNFGATQVVA